MERYKELIKPNPASQSTQRDNTEKSYIKLASYIKTALPNANTILDFGAGKGKGTKRLGEITGKSVESYEPFPREGFTPDYRKFTQIQNKYDIVVSLNMLNVVRPDERRQAVKQIWKCLNKGGTAFISVRKWEGEVKNVKSGQPSDEEEKALVVGSTGAYQKGFDGQELVEYLSSIVGGSVLGMGNKFGSLCAMIKKR